MSDRDSLAPRDWGLAVDAKGELTVAGCSTVSLAREYGTPLHVVDTARLESTAARFLSDFRSAYPGEVRAHFAFKCNGLPAVLSALRGAGLQAEVMSEFELLLALRLGYRGEQIVVNGPWKPESFLRLCLQHRVRYVVVDSLNELNRLDRLGRERGLAVDVLLRINPDFVPRGLNQGAATASRRGCAFGLDLRGGEADHALAALPGLPGIRFHGFHFHIGTGIRTPADYRRALLRIKGLVEHARDAGFPAGVIDVGGGYATATSREMTTSEMLLYQALGRLPRLRDTPHGCGFRDFAAEITAGLRELFAGRTLPTLLLEPGRSIASQNQLLLLTVYDVKDRAGVGTWAITDGGLGTVTMPTFYECHEVLLCDDPVRPRTDKVTIIGPVCFAGDVVYRNKPMPRLRPGHVLAIMDSGAYFLALESSFGFPRPAVVAVRDGRHELVRRRETFEDSLARDQLASNNA
jgi:diaminopimelate decarboxylase